jgi:hypothetical protein
MACAPLQSGFHWSDDPRCNRGVILLFVACNNRCQVSGASYSLIDFGERYGGATCNAGMVRQDRRFL